MKVTDNSTFRLMETNMDRITNRLQELRNQGATGLKLNKPSDDPSAIRPVLTTRTQLRQTDRYLETMGVTLDKMQASDGHLAHVENILVRVKEITINAINGTVNDADRTVLADEIVNLQKELLDAGNATVDGKYIFAGYAENTKPFVDNPAYDPLLYDSGDSTTWPVLYNGDGNPTELEITPGEFTEVNITGNDLFLGISNSVFQAPSALGSGGYPSDPGRMDLFSIMKRTEEALRANNIDNPAGPGGGLQAQMDNLETTADQNRRLRSRLGNRARRVENAITTQTDVKIDLEQILSRYQDADAIETFNDIIQQETAFQAALNISAKVSDVSILDYF
jgi:flagellar hook-associated protein 3 FlgL